MLEKIDAAKKQFEDAHNMRGDDALDPLTLERSEPWLRLLVEIRQIVEGAGNTIASSGGVPPMLNLCPETRVDCYCYPFAVGTNEPIPALLKNLQKHDVDNAAFKRNSNEASRGLLASKPQR